MRLRVANTWDGEPLPAKEIAEIVCFVENDELTVLVDAPYFGDPPPAGRTGSTDELWKREVVELFLVGAQERYLEIELGPHGHYLVLEFKGRRNVVRKGMEIRYETERLGDRWRGAALVPLSYLPSQVSHANAYAIHGTGEGRRYLAAFPVPGKGPDFHRLQLFPEIHWPPGPKC
jgi:hypothetical protein